MKKTILLLLAITLSAALLVVDLVDIFETAPTPVPEELSHLPEDFSRFYLKFHEDKDFQLSRIVFPLDGLPPMVDEQTLRESNFTWQRADWVVHKMPGTVEGDFRQSFTLLDDGLVVEVIRQGETELAIERRWAKLDDRWMLVYYAGTNAMR